MPTATVTRAAYTYPPHFDGARFTNLEPTHDKSLAELLRWQLGALQSGQRGRWRAWVDVAPQPAPPRRVDAGALRVTWVNHATLLVQLDGVNLLTDPIWAERASPFTFAGPRRRHAPGVALDDLPPIHAVLVSHNHYDHMDVGTLRDVARRHRPVIVVGLRNAAYLAAHGVPGALEVDWGDTVRVASDDAITPPDPAAAGAVRVTSVPARHWSARARHDARRTLWSGFVIEGPSGARVYFAGDTGYGAHFAGAARQFGRFDVAILPIGAYRPEWFMGESHMSPAEAVRAARELGAGASVPIHHTTFQLADDGQDEPLDALRAALDAEAARGSGAPTFWLLAPGEGRTLHAAAESRDAAR